MRGKKHNKKLFPVIIADLRAARLLKKTCLLKCSFSLKVILMDIFVGGKNRFFVFFRVKSFLMAVKNRGRPENGFFTREKTMILRKPGLGFRRIAKSCENQNAGKKPLSCIPLPPPTALVFTQTSTQHPISIAPPLLISCHAHARSIQQYPLRLLSFPPRIPYIASFLSSVSPHTQTPPPPAPAENALGHLQFRRYPPLPLFPSFPPPTLYLYPPPSCPFSPPFFCSLISLPPNPFLTPLVINVCTRAFPLL